MKIVKYVLLLLVLATIASTVFIATQEGKYDIKRERTIAVPKMVLFNYINDYRNWENVGILVDSDSTAVFSYSDVSSGEGALMKWNQSDVAGEIVTSRLKDNDSIIQKAKVDGLNSEIYWGFREVPGGTNVVIRQKGELSFTEKAAALLHGGVEDKIEDNISKGLENLNRFLVEELKVFDIKVDGLVNKRAVYYLGNHTTVKAEDLNKRSAEVFQRLAAFAKTNKIATDGMPFIIYKSIRPSEGMTSVMFCMPIKEEIFTASGSEFEGGRLASFKALKTSLKGDYSHLAKAWDTGKQHIVDNALQENTTGQYLEVYTKGTKQSKRPSGWITDIYIPIGQPILQPTIEAAPVSNSTPPLTVPGARSTVQPKTGSTSAPASKPVSPKPKPAATSPAGTSSVVKKPATATPQPATATP